jgi:hypothetical protein
VSDSAAVERRRWYESNKCRMNVGSAKNPS